jgi:hypothetical protein
MLSNDTVAKALVAYAINEIRPGLSPVRQWVFDGLVASGEVEFYVKGKLEVMKLGVSDLTVDSLEKILLSAADIKPLTIDASPILPIMTFGRSDVSKLISYLRK